MTFTASSATAISEHVCNPRNADSPKNSALADYKAQLNRTFEHEARLKELLAKQAQLNAALDLDKHDAQVVGEALESKELPGGFAARDAASSFGLHIPDLVFFVFE